MISQITKRVLIVDDDPILVTILSSVLEKWGYKWESIVNGNHAFKRILEEESPKIIFLDWLIPGMSGIEIIKEVRKREITPRPYIIMLTSKKEKKDIIDALDAGADDFIVKPFDVEELHSRLDVGHRMIELYTKLSLQDRTTSLPNRDMLYREIRALLKKGSPFVLFLINIDKFGRINQALGEEIGDNVLREVGERLVEIFPEEAIVARVFADEFAVLVSCSSMLNCSPVRVAIEEQAKKILRRIKKPFRDLEHIVFTASIGAIFIDGEISSEDPREVMLRASIAMKGAKKKGGDAVLIHDEKMEAEIQEKFKIEQELRKAIKENQLRCYLQPKVDRNRKVVGAEALCRWMHPEYKLVPPGVFIPIAEESNLIIEIDRWMLERVCKILALGISDYISISCNISPRCFYASDFVDFVKDTVESTGADPTRLVLEVTENLMVEDISLVRQIMQSLRKMGIRFSIDDFGTGYSSLLYLQSLPISEVKVDRNFIEDIPVNKANLAIVDAIIGIAKAMDTDLVAEGTRSVQQARLLDKKANFIHQCYLFGKPMPEEEFFNYLQEKVTD